LALCQKAFFAYRVTTFQYDGFLQVTVEGFVAALANEAFHLLTFFNLLNILLFNTHSNFIFSLLYIS
jgi:hypothetical protein